MASRQADEWDGTLWFFTRKSSPKVGEVKNEKNDIK
jgi:general stress protein 26